MSSFNSVFQENNLKLNAEVYTKSLETIKNKRKLEIIRILQKEPERRKIEEFKSLVKNTEGITFFQKAGTSVHTECCKYLRYKFISKGEYVFRYNDNPDGFYIIIQGHVQILVPQNIKHDQLEGKSKDHIQYDESALMKTSELKSGSSFGEIALIQNSARSATVKCLEDSYFATLTSKAYRHTIMENQMDTINQKIRIFHALPMFYDWTRLSIHKLFVFFIEKKYSRGQKLFSAGERSDYIFIIKKGECAIYQKVADTVTQEITAKSVRPALKRRPLRQIKMPREEELLILSAGQFFGYEDFVMGQRPRLFSCVAKTKTKVFTIKIKEFNKRVSYQSTWDIIREQARIFDNLIAERQQQLSLKSEFRSEINLAPKPKEKSIDRDDRTVAKHRVKHCLRLSKNHKPNTSRHFKRNFARLLTETKTGHSSQSPPTSKSPQLISEKRSSYYGSPTPDNSKTITSPKLYDRPTTAYGLKLPFQALPAPPADPNQASILSNRQNSLSLLKFERRRSGNKLQKSTSHQKNRSINIHVEMMREKARSRGRIRNGSIQANSPGPVGSTQSPGPLGSRPATVLSNSRHNMFRQRSIYN